MNQAPIEVKLYRPSNATEGDAFAYNWCERCTEENEDEDKYCEIHGRTFFFGTDDKEYPWEWQQTEQGPVCTAFRLRESTSNW